MEDAEWGGEQEDINHYITEEPPRVLSLPGSIRLRSFTRVFDDDSIRCGRSDQQFYPYKRRRYDDEGASSSSMRSLTQPLLRVLRDPFDIAARQLATFHWLDEGRSAEDIVARFAVDRRLGVRPSLAAVNRAIHTFGRQGRDDAIMDVVEDVMVDGGLVSLSSVTSAIFALQSHPVRAARIALALSDSLGSDSRLPASAWTSLCTDLAQHSHHCSKPLDNSFIDLFESIVSRVRMHSADATLSESLIVDFASCLLASNKPISVAMRLVHEELLSGRASSPMSQENLVRIGGFFSDFLTAVCDAATAKASTSILPYKRDDLVRICGDVIKYAYTRRIHLTPQALDAVLLLCDEQKDYYRLVLLFVAMCVLSVPTLRATLRVVEVMQAIPELPGMVQTALRRSPLSVVLWSLQRFPAIMETRSPAEEHAVRTLCESIGSAMAITTTTSESASMFSDIVTALVEDNSSEASAIASSFVHACRQESKLPPLSRLHAIESVNVPIMTACFHEGGGHPLGRFSAVAQRRDAMPWAIDESLRHVISSPQMYCNILDVTALNGLAVSAQPEEAFVRMMNNYASKTGAVALVPFESTCVSYGLSPAAQGMVQRWRDRYSSWFDIVPFTLSAQLAGKTCAQVCCDLFCRVRAIGHGKVALVTGTQEGVDTAKAASLQPVILLPDLLKKLGVAS